MAHVSLTATQWRQVRYVANFLGIGQLPPILLSPDIKASAVYSCYDRTITVNNSVPDCLVVQVIIHELRHHWQHINGFLKYTGIGFTWCGTHYSSTRIRHTKCGLGVQYLPWEYDAETFEYNMSQHLRLTPTRDVQPLGDFVPPKRNLGQLLKVA